MLDNGDCLEIDENGARISEHIPEAGVVYVDGLHVGDVGDIVIRDRQKLSSDGIATIVVAMDGRTRKVVGEPELIIRGLPIADSTTSRRRPAPGSPRRSTGWSPKARPTTASSSVPCVTRCRNSCGRRCDVDR